MTNSRRAIAGTVAIAVAALVVMVSEARWMQHGVPPPTLSLATWAAFYLLTWLLMTTAMMLPSSMRFLAAVQRIGGTTALAFAASGYMMAWSALGGGLGVAFMGGGDLVAQMPPGHLQGLAGASLVLAGAYQLSRWARACQRACIRPFAILARHWTSSHEVRRNAWVSGMHYGLHCIGCCIAMVVMMLLVGFNDFYWMLSLTAWMTLQKSIRWGARINRVAAFGCIAAGVAIALGIWEPSLRSLRSLCN